MELSDKKVQLLTGRQLEILEIIRKFVKKHGYNPSIHDLAQILGISDTAVNCHRNALERKGFLKHERYTSRAIVLSETFREFKKGVPIWGKIANRKLYKNNKIEYLDISPFQLMKGDYCLVRVEDNDFWNEYSMYKNDFLFIHVMRMPQQDQKSVIIDGSGEIYFVLCKKNKTVSSRKAEWEYFDLENNRKIEICHPTFIGIVLFILRFAF